MHIKVTTKDLAWSYVAQIFQFGAGLFILPVVLKMLPASDLAMWYVFLTIGSFINLLDFGFQPSIARNASYVFSGATRLLARGLDHEKVSGHVSEELLSAFVLVCRKIYRRISLISFAAMIAATWYVSDVSRGASSATMIYAAWAIFAVSTLINFYYSYYASLLVGRGFIKEAKKITVFSRSAYIIVAYVGLLLGGGLAAVSCATLAGCLVTRILSYRFFYTKGIVRGQFAGADSALMKETFSAIWGSSYRLGIVAVGSFLILKCNYLICAKFLGLETAAQYGLTQQLVEFLIGGCMIVFSTYFPMISQDRLRKNTEGVKNKFSVSMLMAFATFIAGVALICTVGYPLLVLIKSKTTILPLPYFLFYAAIMFLELNHSLSASFITTKNEIPFVKPSIVSGALILAASFVLVRFTSLGVLALLVSQFFVQLAYNNWRWPYLVMKELDTSYPGLFLRAVRVVLREARAGLGRRIAFFRP